MPRRGARALLASSGRGASASATSDSSPPFLAPEAGLVSPVSGPAACVPCTALPEARAGPVPPLTSNSVSHMAASGVEVGTHTPTPGRSSCCWGSPKKPELGLEQTNVEKVPHWEPVLPAGPRVPGSAHPALGDERGRGCAQCVLVPGVCARARCVCSSHSWCGSWLQCPVQTGRSSELAHGGWRSSGRRGVLSWCTLDSWGALKIRRSPKWIARQGSWGREGGGGVTGWSSW